MFVPPSFVCSKNLKNIYTDGIESKKCLTKQYQKTAQVIFYQHLQIMI